MPTLSELKPEEKMLVMDAVSAAGIDVSDWANYEGGEHKAAANPKYCYEWSFVEPNKFIVLRF